MKPATSANAFLFEAIEFQYQNNPTTIVALETLDEFMIQNRTYGPIEKGREFEVPRWVAETLISQNKARLARTKVDLPSLQKALWRETGEPPLQPLTPSFYFDAKQEITSIIRKNRESPNDVRKLTQTKMQQALRDLVTNRLLKLMKISLREERIHKTKEKMTEEEKWLSDKLVLLLRNWQRHVLEIET